MRRYLFLLPFISRKDSEMQSPPWFRERNVHLYALHAFSPVRVHPRSFPRAIRRCFVDESTRATRLDTLADTASLALEIAESSGCDGAEIAIVCRASTVLRSSRTTRASEEKGNGSPGRGLAFHCTHRATAIIRGGRTKANVSSCSARQDDNCALSHARHVFYPVVREAHEKF